MAGWVVLVSLAVGGSAAAQCVAGSDGSRTQCYALTAGQNIPAGTVCVTVSGDNLTVTYSTVDGWELTGAHLWVGTSISALPQTRTGNPIPGQFPYNAGNLSGVTTYTFSVPLATLGFSCPSEDRDFLMAAHAALRRLNDDGTVQTETGWSAGTRITAKGNWATISTLRLTCECGIVTPPGSVCETAFARGSANLCFLDLDEDGDGNADFNRWGWTNGPLGVGSHTFELWAAAGQCSTTKGVSIGTVTVLYSSSGDATVSYDISAAGITLREAHIYAGNELLPVNHRGFYTVAPGQYPHVNDDLGDVVSYEFTFSGLSGPIWVVAHAVACGFPD